LDGKRWLVWDVHISCWSVPWLIPRPLLSHFFQLIYGYSVTLRERCIFYSIINVIQSSQEAKLISLSISKLQWMHVSELSCLLHNSD
jgi:hypothetical protein